jgi:hypothetical protein
VSLSSPKQNLALPIAVQRRIDAMFAGTEIGLSGPEMIDYFSRLDESVEPYPWSGGAPSRRQILQDCLVKFSKEQQLDILIDMLRPENFRKYGPPHADDQKFLREWIQSQKQGTPDLPFVRSIPVVPLTSTWDVFISHASEDKVAFAAPLADALQKKGVKVWFDAFTLTVGDSLRGSIDRGLTQSRYGVVILSESFFRKRWPQLELDGLVAREADGGKVILPVWHEIDENRVRHHSPMLAGKLAISSSHGLEYVVAEILRVIRG